MNAPIWIAHRGYPARFPENTLAGFRAAIEAGATWLETDIQLSSDAEPMLYHDETLDRISGTTGLVLEHSSAELTQLNASHASRFGERYAEERIATLAALAELLRDVPRVQVMVELKEHAIERFGVAPLKFVVARHHYRSTLDLADKLFRDNLNSLLDFHRLLARAPDAQVDPTLSDDKDTVAVIAAFEQAMDNDFNSPEALVALEQFRGKIVSALNQSGSVTPEISHRIAVMRDLGGIIGLLGDSLEVVESQGLRLIASILKTEPLSPSAIVATAAPWRSLDR